MILIKRINLFLLACLSISLLFFSGCEFFSNLFGLKDNPDFYVEVVDSSTIRITLTEVRNSDTFVVQRSSTENGIYNEIYRGSELIYTDSGLMAGTTYYYSAFAILENNDRVHYKSNGLAFASAATLPDLYPPSNVSAELIPGTGISYSVRVSWEATPGADFYKLYYTNSYPPANFTDPQNFTEIIFSSVINTNQVTITTTELDFDDSTRYYFYVRSGKTGYSLTSFSETETYIITPGPAWNPSDVQASLSSEGRIILAWSNAPNAERYWIYRDTVENGSYAKIDNIPNTVDPASGKVQYVDTAVTTNTTYHYKIVGINLTFGPNDDAYVSQYVLGFINPVRVNSSLSEPINFTGSFVSGTGVQLSWSAVAGATSYRLYRSIYSDRDFQIIANPVSNSVVDNNQIISGMTYYYKVTALDTASTVESGFSNTVAVMVSQTLNPPTNLSGAAQSDTRVSLSWAVPQGATGTLYYDVYRRSGSDWLIAVQDRNSNDATITGLNPSTTYAFKVQAKTAGGALSSFSNVAEITTLPAIPVVTATASGSSSIDLSWSLSPGAEGYNVYLSTSQNGTYNKRTQTPVLNTTYTITGLSAGTTYYIKVTPLSGGLEPLLSYVTAVQCTTNSLLAPVVSSIGYSSNQVQISWGAVNFATAYEVAWSTSALSNFQFATPTGGIPENNFSFNPVGVSSGYVYVKIRALDGSGGYSEWSNPPSSVLID